MQSKTPIRIGLMATALLSAGQAMAQHGGHGGGEGGGGRWGGGWSAPSRPAPSMNAPGAPMHPAPSAPVMNRVPMAPAPNQRFTGAPVQRVTPHFTTPSPQQAAPMSAQQSPRQWSDTRGSDTQGRSNTDWRRGADRDGQSRGEINRQGWNSQDRSREWTNQNHEQNWNGANRNGSTPNRPWSNQTRDGRNPGVNDHNRNERDWGDRSGGRDWRYQSRLNDRDRWDGFRRWDNSSWRNDRRYNWQDYRRSHGDIFRMRPYYPPVGWYGGYSRFSIGFYLSNVLFGMNYWIDDPYYYRLPPAYGPLRWVRYYDDALLVDIRDGYVVDVIYDFFW